MSPGQINLQNDFQSQVRRFWPFLPQSVLGMMILLQALFEEALRIFAAPVEVLLRRRFGTRGLPFFLGVQLIVTGLAGAVVSVRFNPLIAVFAGAVAYAAFQNLREALRHEAQGPPYRHSYSDGEEQFFWESFVRPTARGFGVNTEKYLSSGFVYRLGEPLVCLLAAGVASLTGSIIFGGYLCGAALALLIKAQLHHNRCVNLERDRRDAEVVGEWMAARSDRRQSVVLDSYMVDVLVHQRPEAATAETSGNGMTPEFPPPSPEEPLPDVMSPPRTSANDTVIEVCRGCQRRLKIRLKAVARTVKCPNCQTAIRIPAAEAIAA